jgi:hypothetical protein
MATYYWIQTGTGTRNWDNGTNWSTSSGGPAGTVVPTSSDDVVFDSNSGPSSGGSQTIVFSTSDVCRTFTISSRTGKGSIAFSDSNYLQIYGSISFDSSSVVQFTGSSFYLKGVSSHTINSGIDLPQLILDNGGTYTQNSNITLNSSAGGSRTLSVTSGTYSTNGYTLSAGAISSGGSLTRTLNISGSTITLKRATPLSLSATSLTYIDNASSSIVVNGSDALSYETLTFDGASFTFNSVTISSPPSKSTVIRSATFGNLTINASSSGLQTFSLESSSITVNGTLTCAGASASQRGFLRSSITGTARTVTAATTTLTDFDFSDITAAGAGSWSGTRLGNAKGNTGITFPASKTVYWKYTGSGLWTDNAWATSSGGSPAVNNFPLPQDTAVFDDAGLTSSAVITLPGQGLVNAASINGTAVTSAKPFTISGGGDFYGSFEVNSNATVGSGTFFFVSRTSQNVAIPSGTTSLAFRVLYTSTTNLTGNLAVGDITVGASQYGAGPTSGTATFTANSYNISASKYTQTSNSRSFGNLGTGTWTITATSSGTVWSTPKVAFGSNTVNGGSETIYISGSNFSTFLGGNQTFGNLYNDVTNVSGLAISDSNTFNSINSTANTKQLFLTAGTTTTVTTFNLNGTSPSLRVLLSKTGGGANPILSKSSGTVDVQFLSISNSTATGGATWNAIDSINGGGNSGWNFKTGNTGFLIFF